MATLKNIERALDILKKYNGNNPYILRLKHQVYIDKNIDAMNDFNIEYTLRNYNTIPKQINKIVKLADWYGEKKREDWKLDFTPEKIKVISLVGETSTTYHCYVQYRKSVPPVSSFILKKGIINNFFYDDYHNVEVDFDRYDKLSMMRDPNHKIKSHQKEAVQFLLSRKKCVLADDMGLGKTKPLCVAAIEGNFDSVLIICPASLKTNWKEELLWYVPERDITIIESFQQMNKSELEAFLGYSVGKSNKKLDELKNEAKIKGKWVNNRFVIVNYDILDEFFTYSRNNKKMIEESPLLQYILNKKSCIIIDEAHRLSNQTSNRYKIIKKLINVGNPHSIYEATGTPITNNPVNFYCVLDLLGDPITVDRQYYLDRYCNAFKMPAKGEKEKWSKIWLKYNKKDYSTMTEADRAIMKQYIRDHARMITIAKGESNLDELKERTQHIYLRRVKEDLNNVVGKTIHEKIYDLTYEQQKEYNRLWDEYEKEQAELDPEKELNKELLEGALYRKYLSNQMVPNTIKLVDKLLETGEKVIIACCYDEELYSLEEYYKDKCVIYNGKCTPKVKDRNKDKFINDPDCKVFIGNINSCGVGLTLIVSKYVVFNNISFVPSDNRQMEDRVHRINQTRDVDIYYQFFRNTQYEKMWNIVLKKELVIDSVIKKEDEK